MRTPCGSRGVRIRLPTRLRTAPSIVLAVTYPAIVAHVYSSPDSYSGGSRTLGPFRPSPSFGVVTVRVGRAPRWLFRARQRMYALNLLRGGSFVGWMEGAPDPRFRLRPNELKRPWYTTLAMAVPPIRLDFAEFDRAMELEAALAEAAVLLAADSTANVIAKRELRGLFLQRSDGKWVKTPEFGISAPTIGVGQPEAALVADALAATRTLGSWRAPAAGPTRIDWALKALLTEEPWSQFVWLMFSLEQVLQEHHRSSGPASNQPWRTQAEAFVRAVNPDDSLNWHRPSVTLLFAALAAHLSAASGSADTASFFGLKKARDRMLHGTQSAAPDGLTRQTARRLTLRYNKLFTMFASAARP